MYNQRCIHLMFTGCDRNLNGSPFHSELAVCRPWDTPMLAESEPKAGRSNLMNNRCTFYRTFRRSSDEARQVCIESLPDYRLSPLS